VTATDIFHRYLVLRRRELLEMAHLQLVGATSAEQLQKAQIMACQSETLERVREALELLDKDPGKFFQEHLKERA